MKVWRLVRTVTACLLWSSARADGVCWSGTLISIDPATASVLVHLRSCCRWVACRVQPGKPVGPQLDMAAELLAEQTTVAHEGGSNHILDTARMGEG